VHRRIGLQRLPGRLAGISDPQTLEGNRLVSLLPVDVGGGAMYRILEEELLQRRR